MADQPSAWRSDGEAFVIHATSGIYEPSTWIVCAYPTKEQAEAEAARMNKVFAEFWQELREIGDGPDPGLDDEALEKAFNEFDAKRDALLKKWREKVGDDNLDTIYEETTYTVGRLPLRGVVFRSEQQPSEEKALLEKIANANVIFPSMCANNTEAMSINFQLERYRTKPSRSERHIDEPKEKA